jgi:hypothetical protein
MKKILKRILIALFGVFVAAQFIRPEKNQSEHPSPTDISRSFAIPQEVQADLHNACYNCHSNTTRYPWYAEIQPLGWWLNTHIQQGKKELNLSEFGGYRLRRQYIKLQQMGEMVEEGEMPLPSYTMVHEEARLSEEQRHRLVAWTNAARDSMKVTYPIDSLERR